MAEQINLGIVGAGRRTKQISGLDSDPRVEVYAVSDVREDALRDRTQELNAAKSFQQYDELLEDPDLDAVYIATPDGLHAEQAKKALESDVHVLSEVPAATSLNECQQLVEAYNDSDAKYMMNDESIYSRELAIVNEMVKAGLFGELYYAEGEYPHRLIEYSKGDYKVDSTPWRFIDQLGRNGATYTTHALAPILLLWMPDDRIASLTCTGSGHHYTGPDGKSFEQEDTTTFSAKTEQGRLIRIRQDFISKRPIGGGADRYQNYQLQGTKGCYESARSTLEPDKVWLEDFSSNPEAEDPWPHEEWMRLSEFENDYLSEEWRNPPKDVREATHGGLDYFLRQDFVEHVINDKPATVGIHDAMDITLPGIMSEQSITDDGRWVDVPDSRTW